MSTSSSNNSSSSDTSLSAHELTNLILDDTTIPLLEHRSETTPLPTPTSDTITSSPLKLNSWNIPLTAIFKNDKHFYEIWKGRKNDKTSRRFISTMN